MLFIQDDRRHTDLIRRYVNVVLHNKLLALESDSYYTNWQLGY